MTTKPTLLLASVLACAAGCTTHLGSPLAGGIDTIDVTLLSPMPGSPTSPATDRDAEFSLSVYDATGALYSGTAVIDVYLTFGGMRSGMAVDCGQESDEGPTPLETLTFTGGQITNQTLSLPDAYGTTSIWVVERGSNATGASVPIYYPNPTIAQIQTPPDPTAANATFCTNFNGKFITVDHPQSATGHLLIESVFGNAVSAVDTSTTDYHSMYLFTYSQPTPDMVPGRAITSFNGNISKFVGFTELNFPVVNTDLTQTPTPELLPAPLPLTALDINNIPVMAAATSSVVQVTGLVCPIPTTNPTGDSTIQNTIDQWVKYDTFVLGTGDDCSSFTEFSVSLPSKAVGTFDPTTLTGKPATITGMLKNSSGQDAVIDAKGDPVACSTAAPCATGTCTNGTCMKAPYNFWTVVIRDQMDVPQ